MNRVVSLCNKLRARTQATRSGRFKDGKSKAGQPLAALTADADDSGPAPLYPLRGTCRTATGSPGEHCTWYQRQIRAVDEIPLHPRIHKLGQPPLEDNTTAFCAA